MFITTSLQEQQRLIFSEPKVLKDNENVHLEAFREYLKENSLTIPEGYCCLANIVGTMTIRGFYSDTYKDLNSTTP